MAPMQSLLVRIIDTVLIFFASLVTGVTPKRPAELVFSPRAKVYYANHNSHGDFVLVWTALPKRWRLVVRPVAGADYWDKGGLRRFLMHQVFNGLLIDRQGHDPQAAIQSMGEALQRGESLIIFPEGTRTVTPPVDACASTAGVIAARAGVPVQALLIEMSTPYLGKHWPLWRPPVLPLSCRVRVGQRWAVLERPQQFGAEIEAYFREAIDPAANQLPDARE